MEYVNTLNLRRRAISRKYLCFSGEFFAKNVRHPAVGDILVPFEAFLNSLDTSLGCTESN